MGGKKKTKWRKLPLEEFTKDYTKTQENTISEDRNIGTKTEEKDSQIHFNGNIEDSSVQYNTEYNENPDNIWYPTHYIIYNPVEIPMYPNYVMPPDANCYYYPPGEINPVQEYGPVPQYQEYVPPVKASALRQPQGSPYDWRNRRRRRRYGGYAEYAIIPEKTSTDEKNKGKTETNSSIAKNNSQVNTVVSPVLAEENGLNSNIRKPNEDLNIAVEPYGIGEKHLLSANMSLTNDERNEREITPNKTRRNLEICGVHSKYPEKRNSCSKQSENTNKNRINSTNNSEDKNIDTTTQNQEETLTTVIPKNFQNCAQTQAVHKPLPNDTEDKLKNCTENSIKTNSDVKLNCSINTNNPEDITLIGSQKSYEIMETAGKDFEYDNSSEFEDKIFNTKRNNTKFMRNISSSSLKADLPDILNALNEVPVHHNYTQPNNNKNSYNDVIRDLNPLQRANYINESVSKSKVSLSQTNYMSNSDSLSIDSETTLNQPLKSKLLQGNNSIYKLAYDESITDQSEADSRSSSPIDPESQMPSSLLSHEINVYEADSEDDAGSEDLELIPHRYESESFLNKNKHVYENKLSLAVELLRTRESLPYDAQFKRVVEDSCQEQKKEEHDKTGAVNLGFVDDSNMLDSFEMKNENFASSKPAQMVITNQYQTSKHNTDSFGISLEDSYVDSCEIANEVNAQAADNQENTEGINAAHRRIGVQFRHYFSPRSTLISPWNCCLIM